MSSRSLKILGFVVVCLGVVLPGGPAAAQPPVVVVSGAGTPAVNGSNLLTALTVVRAPDGLVQLEPGVYDVGTVSVVVPDGVDIAGSGRGVTTIRSATGAVPVVFNPGVHSELRDVRVENHSLQFANQPAVRIASDFVHLSRVDVSVNLGFQGTGILLDACSARLTHVTVAVAPRINDSVIGVYAVGGAPVFEDLEVVIAQGGILGTHRGVVLSDAAATIDGLTVVGATDHDGYSVGVSVEDHSPDVVTEPVLVKIRDADIQMFTDSLGQQAYGVTVSHNHLELRDSKAVATSTSFWTYTAGLVATDDTQVVVYGSTLRGAGDGGRGVISGSAIDTSNPSLVVHHSVVEGSTAAYDRQDGTISFGASQLLGGRPGGVTCANSYDVAFAVLNGPC
jgi:hypothetical protein